MAERLEAPQLEAPFSFNARIALANRAEMSIGAQYYEVRADGEGRQFHLSAERNH